MPRYATIIKKTKSRILFEKVAYASLTTLSDTLHLIITNKNAQASILILMYITALLSIGFAFGVHDARLIK